MGDSDPRETASAGTGCKVAHKKRTVTRLDFEFARLDHDCNIGSMDPFPLLITAWPTLLTTQEAARYLSSDISGLEKLMSLHSVYPVLLPEGKRRWRKNDLDKAVRRMDVDSAYMNGSGSPPTVRLDGNTIDALASTIRNQLNLSKTKADSSTLVSIGDTTKLLGIGRSSTYRLIENGQLTKIKIGRRALITKESIERLLGGEPEIG